jgi:hypothetical protein
MEFIPACSDYTAQVKTTVEQGHCLPLRPFVGFFLTYEDLNLLGQEAADGSGTPRGDNPGLLNCFPVKTDRHVLLAISFWTRHFASIGLFFAEHVYYV